MNFANVKSITIPEGSVKKITAGGVVLWEKITSRLPSEYQEVEYIQDPSGTDAHIDLGFSFVEGATIYINYIIEKNTTTYLFGAAENSGKLRCMITHTSDAEFYGSNGSSYIFLKFSRGTIRGENNFRFQLKKGALQVEDLSTSEVLTNTTQAEYTMTNNLCLFGQNYNGTKRFNETIKLKSFSYYNKDDVLICDLIPCYRKSDGVIGMYDIARKIFLTNAGTGIFIKGNDV